MKITKSAVEKAAAPDKGQSFYWDDTLPGFGLRVTATGTRSYIAQSRANGKTRRTTIGRHGVLTADEARKRARAEIVRMTDGVDPAKEKRRVKADAERDKVLSVTLSAVVESYLRDRRKLKDRSRRDIKRHVDVSFKDWADKPIAGITRDMVSRKFRKLTDRSPAQANQAFRNLRAFINYAQAQYRTPDDLPIIIENPVDVLSQSQMWNEIKPQKNAVPVEKMGAWWAGVQRHRSDPALTPASRTAADLFAFIAVTGMRIGEASSIECEHVDQDDASLTLPDTKNGEDITLPLSTVAMDIIRDRLDGRYIFRSRSGDAHMSDLRATVEKMAELTSIRVTPHDLRRGFRRIAGEINIELWRTKALMNHKQNEDVTLKHYTDLSDVRFLRDDAEKIGNWLERQRDIFERVNVVAFKQEA